ncbi:uncharacterized protein LOC144642205 [Oculina patagonica]
MSRETLIQQKGITKRKITNLLKKVEQVVEKEDKSAYDIVCAEQYLNEIRTLDAQFQKQHLAATAIVEPSNEELIERDFEDLEIHDERVRENTSKLLYLLNVASKPQAKTKATENKTKVNSLEAKWTRITKNVDSVASKVSEAQSKLDEMEIDELTDIRSQLSDFEKTFDRFTAEIDSVSPDLDDKDGESWNDAISNYFDKISLAQDTLALLIIERRRNQTREIKEQELEREERRNKEIEVQNNKHREEINKLLDKLKTPSEEHESKTVKLPSLSIPSFDGDPTKWKSYWQQFEATIHNSKKLDDQLRMQYLLKSLTTKKARDAIEGIDAVAEAYPEAVAALKNRFDRPQVIHRAHVRAILNLKPMKDGSSGELRKLHDTLQHHLRSLKAMDQLDFERFMTALGECKLDDLTMVEWQKSIQAEKQVPGYDKLLEFLDLRAIATELAPHETGPKKPPIPPGKSPKPPPPKPFFVYTANTKVKCTACNGSKHNLAYCQSFKAKSLSEKRNFVMEQGLCFNCLKAKHTSKQCPSPNCCLKCGKRHHTFLHLDDSRDAVNQETSETARQDTLMVSPPGASNTTVPGNIATDAGISTVTYVTASEAIASNSILMMTAEVILSGPNGHQMVARALLDPASTASFITERVVQRLKMHKQRQEITINGIGDTRCSTQSNSVVNMNLKSTQSSSALDNVQAIVLPSLTKCLPITTFPKGNWPHLSTLKLADPEFNVSKPIDVLLGVDVYHDILKPGLILGPKGTPAAQATMFGWVLFGNTNTHQLPAEVTTLHASTSFPSCEETLHKFWTLEEPPKPRLPLSPADKLLVQDFDRSHKRDETGRFVVRLPFKPQGPPLGQSRPLALRRFLSLERRLQRFDKSQDYAKVVNEYFTLGHAERVPEADLNKPASHSFYLAHHAVYKDSASTPLRVVFDGSMKTTTGVSLNDQLLVGPTVHPPLNDVLIRFRQHPYVLTTDVSKMYRAVVLAPEDRDFHRFLWRENATDPVVDYRMTRVTFGIASAPFLATNSVLHLAKQNESELPLAAKAVTESFYVDDGLPSVETKQEAILLHHQLQDLFNRGGFKLHKWDSNSPEVLNSISPEIRNSKSTSNLGNSDNFVKTLGMEYNSSQDHFKFSSTDLSAEESSITKREVLSDSAKIFDPLGLISCVTIVPKIIFQRLWERGTAWDEPLPPDIQREWLNWRTQLPEISAIRIPRCYTPVGREIVDRQLIGFSDASEKAYCGVVYLRSFDTAGGVYTSLVMAKTRVAPIKKITLPRLELCGAHLLSQLMKHLQEILAIPTCKLYAFTDSTIVLYWIYGSSQRFKTFEANRIGEIQESVPPERWAHVASEENPADVGSRGLLPGEIIDHKLWWNGPSWLKEDTSNWQSKISAPPSLETLYSSGMDEASLQLKERKEVTLQVTTPPEKAKPVIDIERYSSFMHLVRVTAWVFRVVTRTHLFSSTPLSVAELSKAKIWLFKLAQAKMFPDAVGMLQKGKPLPLSHSLQPLNPFLDADGLLRVGGRLSQSQKAYLSRHPLILHGKHHLTSLIIQSEHKRLCHAGPKLTLGSLQDLYHIVGARRAVRKCTRQCVTCQRASPKITTQLMGQVPAARLLPGFANERVSVDYAGPLTLKIGTTRRPTYYKAYVAIFVCLATESCHIELVSNLTAEAFLAAFRRFVSRKGKPIEIWSDNASCFHRANKDLKELEQCLTASQESIMNYCSTEGIQWKFSPPTGPHHGSVWENGVKACKRHLKRIVGESKLTFEEMTTVLCQIEACLNSRPLFTSLDSNDDDGIAPLTPGHFLIGRPLEALPDQVTKAPISTLKRWQLCQALIQHFWKRWSTEYLNALQRFNKWRRPKRCLRVDDIVLIKDNRTPPCQWPLGRIIRTHPGPDQLVRVVTVKTKTGTFVRPVVKLCLLTPSEGAQ